jgi:hypothetical protein
MTFVALLDVNPNYLFQCEENGSGCYKVLYPPRTGTTEDSFHQFWDDLINDSVELFCPERVSRDRNTNHFAFSGNLRPDLIGSVRQKWALLRAEEKSPYTAGDPRTELLEKLLWTYHGLPYIFAYFARGANVTLTALYQRGANGAIEVEEVLLYFTYCFNSAPLFICG